MLRSSRPVLLVCLGLVLGLVLGALGYAAARPATRAAAPAPKVKVCTTKRNVVVSAKPSGACPARTRKRAINVIGPRGPQGPRGAGVAIQRIDRALPFSASPDAVVVAPGVAARCLDETDPVRVYRASGTDAIIGSFVTDRSGMANDGVDDWNDSVISLGPTTEVLLELVVTHDGVRDRVDLVITSRDLATGCGVRGTVTRL